MSLSRLPAAVTKEDALHPAGDDNPFPDHIGSLPELPCHAYRSATGPCFGRGWATLVLHLGGLERVIG